jgi:hypothetical protein
VWLGEIIYHRWLFEQLLVPSVHHIARVKLSLDPTMRRSGKPPHHFLLLDLRVEVKSCITYHLIASLHLNHEGRYILLFTVGSICDDIYYVVVQLQSCIFKMLLNQL